MKNRLPRHREEKPIPKNTLSKLKESMLMKNTPVEAGWFAVASPLPMFFVTSFWGLFLFFGIYIGLLNMDVPIPAWVTILSVIPILISPLLCVLGVIHGIIKRKEKGALLGILLSAFGLAENFLLFCAMAYLSRF